MKTGATMPQVKIRMPKSLSRNLLEKTGCATGFMGIVDWIRERQNG